MDIREKLKGIRAFFLGIDPFLMKIHYRYFYKPKKESLIAKINEKLLKTKNIHLMQIGGNDGFSNDSIFKVVKSNKVKGIIIEPQKFVFEKRLKRTYSFNKNIILENVAIDNGSAPTRKLYQISISKSRWATGLASFNKEILLNHLKSNRVKRKASREGIELPEDKEMCITYEEVKCYTIKEILKKHSFEKLDLLQIDTEGYDYEIIKSIDFKDIKIKIIIFEHIHLSPENLQSCYNLLKENGYKIEKIGSDTFAEIE